MARPSVASVPDTPEKKQNFDWIYVKENPTAYKTEILDGRNYICDNHTRGEFDRLIRPKVDRLAAQREGGKINITDLGCCFGNTTLALVHGMTTDQIRENWKDDVACEKINAPRRLPCKVTGIDLSENALKYCKRAGIMDETIEANLNTEGGLASAMPALRDTDIFLSTATLVYLDIESVRRVVKEFAQGAGEGYAIVNFLNPFELEKTDAMKRILLEHLDFVGSTASQHRTMSEFEKGNYPGYGDWALLEIWTLKRRGVGQARVAKLTAEEDIRAQAYYDSDDAYEFYKQIWGGDNLHVGIYDETAMKAPLGPERVKIASEVSLERLVKKRPPAAGSRVIDMGSAYGGCARYIATQHKAFVSCVDLSAKENERNREMTKAAGLDDLVYCPGERSFTTTGEKDGSFDLVVSEDSFLHAGQHRRDSIAEAARVLRPGGHLVFTDIMQSDTCYLEQMAPVYKRINLDDMGSPQKYKEWATSAGLVFEEFEDLTDQLPKHYGTVRSILLDKHEKGELRGKLSDEFVQKMSSGLQSWVDQAGNNNLAWGIFVFQKPGGAKRSPSYAQLCGSPKSPLKKSPSYKEMNASGGVTQALVVASSRLSALDSHSGPKCLIRLGNLPIICHVLSQLQHAGVERAVVLCGFQADKIKHIVQRDLDEDCKLALKIEFVPTGEAWRQGSAYSILESRRCFGDSDRFLVCMADHIFDPAIIANVCAAPTAGPNSAISLVEPDFEGMVGMPPSSVKVKLVENGSIKVSAISPAIELKEADGVDAGLFVCDASLFQQLQELADEQAYFSIADAMNRYAARGALQAVKTEGKMWFAVETKEALAFAVADGLKQMGTVPEDENWLSEGAYDQDGRRIPISIAGKGKEMKNANASSKWSEFTVERWRSAVYINLSYFADLYTDSINFTTDIAKHMKLRGQRVTLVEVGCGTGEFVRPIADHFRLAIGLDFNKAFIDFCNQNIPKGKEEKMTFIEGDACKLIDELKEKAPKHIWSDTKIVACVGNTIGIIPENLKERVYHQMTELAGEDGVVVIVYWNARCFGDACQNFYHANPQLCGPFSGESIDFNTTTLTTPAPWNYRTHWTGIEEAREKLRSLGLEEIMVEERGKGVLVAARKNTKSA